VTFKNAGDAKLGLDAKDSPIHTDTLGIPSGHVMP
jgi:hypothetical protein